jgi:hypothetical protein
MATFAEEFTLPVSIADARAKLASGLTPLLSRRGFVLVDQADDRRTWEYRYCPQWARAAGLLTFWTLIGLAFFAVRHTDQVIAILNTDDDGGTRVTASGTATAAVARAFREIRD